VGTLNSSEEKGRQAIPSGQSSDEGTGLKDSVSEALGLRLVGRKKQSSDEESAVTDLAGGAIFRRGGQWLWSVFAAPFLSVMEN